MRGYLSPVGRDSEIPVEAVTEVYRDPGDTQEVMIETGQRVVSTGVTDPTVSRKKGDEAPVRIVPQSEAIEIQNRGNTNGVTLDPNSRDVEIEDGYARRVQDTTTFQIGYQTTLTLTVERDARIQGVEGDVVLGDQTKVNDAVLGRNATVEGGGDGSTTVDDSVVGPDADVGGGDTKVSDSVVGPRASVGGDGDDTDTESFCSTHQRTYRGPECPACAADGSGASPNEAADSKYCIFCGTSIPAAATVCSNCGKDQPNA